MKSYLDQIISIVKQAPRPPKKKIEVGDEVFIVQDGAMFKVVADEVDLDEIRCKRFDYDYDEDMVTIIGERPYFVHYPIQDVFVTRDDIRFLVLLEVQSFINKYERCMEGAELNGQINQIRHNRR